MSLLAFSVPVAVSAQAEAGIDESVSEGQTAPTTTTTPTVSSNIADNVCRGVMSVQSGTFSRDTTIATCQDSADEGFGFLARRIINIFSVVVGAVSVIMIIIGGFRYIISGGDSGNVQSAKNTILYAIVGLLIVLFAQVIIRFILSNAVQTN